MRALEAVLFDCDGVLFDSWRANVAFYDAVLVAAGAPPLDAEWERRAHVMSSSQLFEALFAGDAELRARVHEASRATDYGPFYELMQPVEGLEEILGVLKQRYRLGMASNRGRTVLEVVRRFGLDRWFDAAVGARDVERAKPHPDMLLLCAERLNVAPARTLYVGDAVSDLAAAEAAGMQFVAVGEVDGARRRIAHLRDLPGWVRSVEF